MYLDAQCLAHQISPSAASTLTAFVRLQVVVCQVDFFCSYSRSSASMLKLYLPAAPGAMQGPMCLLLHKHQLSQLCDELHHGTNVEY